MKSTIFKDKHIAFGARMVEFAGFYLPVQFEGIIAEHNTVRNSIGLFDVSHMGEIWVEGPGSYDLVQKVTSNDISTLTAGKVQYSCLPNESGGIIDDLLVYCLSSEQYLLVVNAANIEKDFEWLNYQNIPIGATITDRSDVTSQLAIQGPLAMKAMQQLTDEPIIDLPNYTFKVLKFAGVQDVLLSVTGYTGAGGCEIYFPNEKGTEIFDNVMDAGRRFGMKPAGLAARDTLRLEMGYCLYGNDINDKTSPVEAGLGWITRFTPGNDFVNRQFLEQQKKNGVMRKLVGFEVIDKGIPRQYYQILESKGKIIGEVTSGTMSPTLNKPIGMGYVASEFSAPGNKIYINIRGKAHEALIVKRPFI